MILVCGCVGIFTTLHITALSGRYTLVIICNLCWSSRGGNTNTYFENLRLDATGYTLSLPIQLLLKPRTLYVFLYASLLFSSILGRKLLNQHFLVYILFCLSTQVSLPHFLHRVYNSCAVSCASSPLLLPPRSHPRLFPLPGSRSRICY